HAELLMLGNLVVEFDFLSPLGEILCIRNPPAPVKPRASTEELFQKDAEPRAAKLEIKFRRVFSAGESAEPTALPSWRRTEVSALFPIRSQLVVLLAFFRVPQDFVGLVDLLKLRFCIGFVLGHIWMVLPGELPKRFADF